MQENKQTQIILRTLCCVGEENDKTMSVLYQENEPDWQVNKIDNLMPGWMALNMLKKSAWPFRVGKVFKMQLD